MTIQIIGKIVADFGLTCLALFIIVHIGKMIHGLCKQIMKEWRELRRFIKEKRADYKHAKDEYNNRFF